MTTQLMDHAVFAELSDTMGADFAAELVTTFLSEAPGMLTDLKDAVASQDADAYRRAAHSIKSNAQIFGADALAHQARAMELGDLAETAPSVPALETTFAQTAQALKDLIDG